MQQRKKVLAICGSTRSNSTNLNFILAISALYELTLDITVFLHISELPHFNPDLDTGDAPAQIAGFRKQIKEADGVLICTPEYALGVPGSLKNALDWTVSSCEFSHKPVALITASTGGQKAHESLLSTLKMIEANVGEKTQLLISFAKTKVNHHFEITDKTTLQSVEELVQAFINAMDKRSGE